MMKINNKGYSLTELLLTLVVFGFVMLGIATIMRTTSVSYKDGDAQVTLQTEAQIVANQIEELLVDAKIYDAVDVGYLSSGTYAGDKFYSIKAQSGLTHYIMLDDATQRLYYQQNGTGEGTWSLMAEYVSDIDIDGYSTATADAECDNMVTLEVTLDKQGYEYTAVKDVFFRNAVEDNTVMQIASLVNGSTPSSTIKKTVEVDRYAILDLKNDCDLDTSQGFTIIENGIDKSDQTGLFGDYYQFVSVTYTSTGENKDFMNSIVSVSTSTTMTGYICTNNTVNMDFSDFLAADKKVTLVGKTTQGKDIEITLTTKAVAYNVNKTGKTADGFLTVTSVASDLERYNMIEVDGINLAGFLNGKINTAVAATNRKISFKMVAYKDDDASTGSGYKKYEKEEKIGNTPTLKELSSVGGQGNKSQICGSPMMDVGLAVDNVTGNLAIHTDPFGASTDYANGNYRVAVMIYIPNNVPSTAATTVLDFNVYQQGDSMEKYTGGNQYTGKFTDSEWN